MNSAREFFKLLGKIILTFGARERIIVILLFGVIIASSLQLIFGKTKETIIEIKGIYTEGLVGKAHLLNPLFVDFNDVDRDLSQLIFSGLIKYDPEKRNFFPDLAAYELSEDKLTYTFTVKDGIKWHDGEPFGIDDVYFTYHDILQDPGFINPILKSTFQGITIQKIDDKQISFTLKEPNSFFISNMMVGILPKHLLGDTPFGELDKADFNHNPVGTGPYMVDTTPTSRVGKYDQINLVRADEYYGDIPSLTRLRFIFYPNWQSLLAEIDAQSGISRLTESQWEEYLAEDGRFARFKYRLPQYTGVFFNLDHPTLGEKSIRQAFAQAVDRDSLVQLLGSKQVVDTVMRERAESEIYKYSKEEAEDILDSIGWKKGEDGFRKKGDAELRFRLIARSFDTGTPQEEESKQIVDFLRNSWEGIGVKIVVQRLGKEEMLAAMENRTYDLLITGHNVGYNNDAYSFWHSSQTGSTGLNLSNIRSFRVDSLLEGMRSTFDLNKKWAELDQLATMLADELPALLLFTPEYTFAVDTKYKGFTYQGFAFHSDRFNNIASVTLDKS